MFTAFSNKAKNSIHVSIGDEGIVLVQCRDGATKAKLFARSTDEGDTAKIRQLLHEDSVSPIYLYIDTLDQSYIQRTIPTAGTLGIGNLARKRLEKDIPKNHLKACIQLERLLTGRRDYVYTFMSTPLEPPLTTWLEFFLPYMNIIQGIYLLPVEIHSLIQKLKSLETDAPTQGSKTTPYNNLFKQYLLSIFPFLAKANTTNSETRWELFLSQNKTGGFRQVAYHQGKIIFSRLLNNISHSDPDVIAGDIEQEIANSVEYLVRLSLSGEEDINMYLVLSEDILKFIRQEKLKATRVFRYTPHSLAVKLNLKDASGEKDKFADPTILTGLATIPKRKLTLQTPITERVFKFTQKVKYTKIALNIIVPIILISCLTLFNNIFGLRSSIKYIVNQAATIKTLIDNNNKIIQDAQSRIGQDIEIDHLNEIIDYYIFMTQQQVSPDEILNKLAQVLPEISRAKLIRWNFQDNALFNTKASDKNQNLLLLKDTQTLRKNTISLEIEMVLSNYGKTAEDLQKKYIEVTNLLNTNFKGYRIEVSDLPQIFGLQTDISQPVTITIKLIKTFDPALKAKDANAPQTAELNSPSLIGSAKGREHTLLFSNNVQIKPGQPEEQTNKREAIN